MNSHHSLQASKEFIAHNIERGKHRLYVRYFPDYPISLRPSNTRRGGGKNKVAEYKDYVMAGTVFLLFIFQFFRLHYKINPEIHFISIL